MSQELDVVLEAYLAIEPKQVFVFWVILFSLIYESYDYFSGISLPAGRSYATHIRNLLALSLSKLISFDSNLSLAE